MHAIVAAWLNPAPVSLPAAVHAAAIAHAAAFVEGQVSALALHYRSGFVLGLRAVDTSALRWGARSFVALTPSQQAELLHRWSVAPLPQARQLMRLIRTSALLAYFEFPGVVAAAGGAR